MNSLVNELKRGRKGVAIWGLGYVGYSSMAYLCRAGIRCLGYDIEEERVRQIKETGKIKQEGEDAVPNIDLWLGFDVGHMHKAGLVKATGNWKELISKEYPVHLIAVPTELAGEPYNEHLKDVFQKLSSYKDVNMNSPPLIIVESTLSNDVLDKNMIPLLEKNGLEVGKDILLGVAPRRDWFVDPDKTLKTIPRVVGGTNKETTDLMAEVLRLISDTILKADDHKHAAIVKSIENAYRQLEITFANQLSLAYPNLNMKDILKLVGTKWNIGTYHPSFGIGGYCIPVAPKYVMNGAEKPEHLTLLKHSIESNDKQPLKVVESLVKRGVKDVAILGIAYSADLKVHILSPALPIIKGLKEAGINVKVHDPYYTEKEIKKITGAEPFDFPNGLNDFDAVLLVADHMAYKFTSHEQIINNLKNCKLVLDNTGAWKNVPFNKIEYHEAGDANWLG